MIINENLMRLQLINGVGRKTLIKLIKYLEFGNFNNLSFKELVEIIQEKILLKRLTFNIDYINREIEKIFTSCYKYNIQIVGMFDNEYPHKLINIDDKPIILYILGNNNILKEENNIAIIGSRYPTRKGYEIGTILSEKLAIKGYNIISGLALGCDTAGHKGCLYGKGKTAAIIPSGHEYIYPRANKRLYYQIIEKDGVIVSELPPLTKPKKYDFIDRDRLQAAFSEGLIVIESNLKSGTTYTVEFGLKYGKQIGCSGHTCTEKPNNFNLNRKLINDKLGFCINDINDLYIFAEKSIEKKCSFNN